MTFDLSLSPAHHELVRRTHQFAIEKVRPVAAHYDRAEEFPWPVLEEAAEVRLLQRHLLPGAQL